MLLFFISADAEGEADWFDDFFSNFVVDVYINDDFSKNVFM